MLQRLGLGIDLGTYVGILNAKKPDGTPFWTGTSDDLAKIVVKNKLGQPSKHLPVREAIDWVYSSVYTTIKAMKFANLPPVCGGPIEVDVITSDRYFRWVRHKDFDAAIGRDTQTGKPEMSDRDRIKSSIEWMENAPPAQWVQEMRDHYHRTGTYRAKDIRRVMGDQTVSVKVVCDPSQAARQLSE